MVCTRPDIAFAVGVASRALEKPTADDVLRVKRICRYLKGSEELGIVHRADEDSCFLDSYSDADLGEDIDTGRSTSGIISI